MNAPNESLPELMLRAGRNRIAMRRLAASPPRPMLVPYLGSGWMLLVIHRSAKRPGWWQATTWDLEGPVGDCENPDWTALLEHAHGYGIDWKRATDAEKRECVR